MLRTLTLVLVASACSLPLLHGAIDAMAPALPNQKPEAAGLDFFEKKIRPVLVKECYGCHSAEAKKIKGNLVLDTRDGIRRGGDSGPAVVPGNLNDSLLIEAIRYGNKDFAMPPLKSGGQLPAEVVKDFEKWVQMGAPDPRGEAGAKVAARAPDNWEKAKDWWAWKSPEASPAPAVHDLGWVRGDLDRFVLSALEAKGLKPVGDADRVTLLRRITFDLTGLPPTPAQLDAFLRDPSPGAYSKVVDSLLASPQFGETWGRHWLDVARYAESAGKDANIAFPHAWRYRDYVIQAFNSDKPYDQFITEQVAGDLMPSRTEEQKADRIVATGFLALGAKGLNEQNPRQFALDLADEQIDATTEAFMGMTVACARCHDHKFDPIPQRDYYAMAGIFLSTDTHYGTAAGLQNRHATELLELPAGAHAPVLAKTMSTEERTRKEKRLEEVKAQLREVASSRLGAGPGALAPANPGAGPGKAGAPPQIRALLLITQLGLLNADLNSFDASGRSKPLAMGVQDEPATRPTMGGGFGFLGRAGGGGNEIGMRYRERMARPPEFRAVSDSAVYARGDADKPGEKVPRGFISIATHSTPPSIPPGSSGRLELAQWLTAPSNPLTARVMVNRVWHWLFGAGLVGSTDNFGTTGTAPTNQALLDTLAVKFAEGGWSVKRLIREMVLSHTYQLASTYDDRNFAADPENTLLWRMSKRRLEAEAIRDAILATSGLLQMSPPVGSLIAQAGDGPVGQARIYGISEETIVESGAKLDIRSVYLPIARDVLPDALAVFDFAEPSMVCGVRESTNVPAQALYLLNSPFVDRASHALASRIMAAHPSGPNGAIAAQLEPRMVEAYRLIFSRSPTAAERQAGFAFFTQFPGSWKKGDEQAVATHDAAAIDAAWASFCRALLASAEFRYLN